MTREHLLLMLAAALLAGLLSLRKDTHKKALAAAAVVLAAAAAWLMRKPKKAAQAPPAASQRPEIQTLEDKGHEIKERLEEQTSAIERLDHDELKLELEQYERRRSSSRD